MRKWLYRLALSAFVLITAVAGFNIISGLVMYRQNAAVTKEAEEKLTHSDIPEKDRSGAKINRWQASTEKSENQSASSGRFLSHWCSLLSLSLQYYGFFRYFFWKNFICLSNPIP